LPHPSFARAPLAGKLRFPLNQPYLVLLHGDRDAIFLEQAPDLAVHVGTYVVDAVHGIADPETHFDAHAVVLEAHEPRHRPGILEDTWIVGRRVDEHPQRHFRIIGEADHHRQAYAHALIGIAPVDHLVVDEVLVVHQRLDA